MLKFKKKSVAKKVNCSDSLVFEGKFSYEGEMFLHHRATTVCLIFSNYSAKRHTCFSVRNSSTYTAVESDC